MTVFVKELNVYPLKSGRQVPVSAINVTPYGLEHDRRWMLIHTEGSKKGHFVSQRDRGCERLALIRTNFETHAGQVVFYGGGRGAFVDTSLTTLFAGKAIIHKKEVPPLLSSRIIWVCLSAL